MSLPTPKPGIMDITPYTPGKSSREAGVVPIKLSSNENPYGPNPKAVAAYKDAAAQMHRYPDAGASALREAIGEVCGLDAARIVCGAGSDELIGLLVHAYASEGDEVLFSQHGFLMYAIYARSFGATPVKAPETNLKADVDNLLAAVTTRTKIVFIANPNNPTGSYLPASEIKRLRDGLPEHVILCLDDAYAEYMDAPDYSDGVELVDATENTVMCRTFSKIYGMGGLRIGWMYAPTAIIDVMHRVRSPFNVNSAAQAAAIAAIKDTGYTEEQRLKNKGQLAWLSSALKDAGLHVFPSVCNFVLVRCKDDAQAKQLIGNLAAEHIYVRDVSNYELPDCIRISVGTPEENQRLMERITAHLGA